MKENVGFGPAAPVEIPRVARNNLDHKELQDAFETVKANLTRLPDALERIVANEKAVKLWLADVAEAYIEYLRGLKTAAKGDASAINLKSIMNFDVSIFGSDGQAQQDSHLL